MSRVRNVSLVPRLKFAAIGYFGGSVATCLVTLLILLLFAFVLPAIGLNRAIVEIPEGRSIVFNKETYLQSTIAAMLFIFFLWPLIAGTFVLSFIMIFQAMFMNAEILQKLLSIISILFVVIVGGIVPFVVHYRIYLLYKRK